MEETTPAECGEMNVKNNAPFILIHKKVCKCLHSHTHSYTDSHTYTHTHTSTVWFPIAHLQSHFNDNEK